MGDMELGAKYRFIQEKGWRPQVGIFPMFELPSGDSSRGLGNGETWYKLPIWVQKGFGHGWQSYGGGGYIVNPAPGMRNTPFFGWQLQKEINKKLTLGGEWFNPGRQSFATRNYHLVNFGVIYNFYKNVSLLFTLGHSFQGPAHTVAYAAFYWTFGKKPDEEDKGKGEEAKPAHADARAARRRTVRTINPGPTNGHCRAYWVKKPHRMRVLAKLHYQSFRRCDLHHNSLWPVHPTLSKTRNFLVHWSRRAL